MIKDSVISVEMEQQEGKTNIIVIDTKKEIILCAYFLNKLIIL